MSIENKLDEIIKRIEHIEQRLNVQKEPEPETEYITEKKTGTSLWLIGIIGFFLLYAIISFVVDAQNPYSDINYNRSISFAISVILILIVLFVVNEKRKEKNGDV